MRSLYLGILLALLAHPGAGAPQRERAGRASQQVTSEEKSRAEAVAKFEAGQTAHEQGRLAEAIELYSSALQQLPNFSEALYQRAAAYFALDRLEESERDLAQLLEQEPDLIADAAGAAFMARAHTLLAEVLLRRNRLPEAETHARRALTLDPNFPRAHLVRASIALARRAPAEAIAELARARELGLETASLYTLLGLAHEQKGEIEAALHAYSRALERDPKASAARQARSRLWLERRDYARALEDLEVLAQSQPTTDIEQRLAETYALAGRTEEAIALFQKILAREPTHREARQHLITLLERAGRLTEALAQAQQWVAVSPDDPRAHALLGELLLPHDPEAAARAFERAAQGDRENLAYRANLGAALLKLRRFPEAAEVFRTVLARDPNHYPAHAGLGTAYFELKDYAQAAREFAWVVRRKPDSAVAHYFLAICYDRLGQYEQALPMYERFLALADPATHRTEIESARFRLPALRRQIEEAQKRRRR